MKLHISIYFPTLGQAKDEVDGWLEKGSLASGWPSSSVRRTNATVHTRHHMAVKVNNFSKNSNILYLDWWEVRGCSKCCLPAPDGRPPILLFFWWADHHTVQREIFFNFPKKDQTSNQVQTCPLIRVVFVIFINYQKSFWILKIYFSNFPIKMIP